MCEKITLAGVLEIHVEPEHVKVYTVYRNDKINHTANPIKLHYGMNAREHNVEPMEKTEWNAKQVEISFVNTIQWSGWILILSTGL